MLGVVGQQRYIHLHSALTTNSEKMHYYTVSYCLLNNTALQLQTGTKQSVIGPTKNNPHLMKSLKNQF